MVQKVSEKVQSIRSKRRKRDSCVGIGFKANPVGDQDIVTWWYGLPAGTRSDALRHVLRIALFPTQPSTAELQFDQVVENMNWIRNALSELPSFLERHLLDVRRSSAIGEFNTTANTTPEDLAQLNGDELEHRRNRLLNAAW
ncbi:MAG: hypothetical protein KF726_10020 [Anaerolineae bacterium]|nr:hypothetical protein [Anaerolineae bacterium]